MHRVWLIAFPDLLFALLVYGITGTLLQAELGAGGSEALLEDGSFRVAEIVMRRPQILAESQRWLALFACLAWFLRPLLESAFLRLEARVSRLLLLQLVYGLAVASALALVGACAALLEAKLNDVPWLAFVLVPLLVPVLLLSVLRDLILVHWGERALERAATTFRRAFFRLLSQWLLRAPAHLFVGAALLPVSILWRVFFYLTALLLRAWVRATWLTHLQRIRILPSSVT